MSERRLTAIEKSEVKQNISVDDWVFIAKKVHCNLQI